jgi:hypothetical protein
MAGRRVVPPGSVAAVSLSSTGDAGADRVMQQAEEAIEGLQTQLRRTGGLQAGRHLGLQRFTGSGTYTPTAGTVLVRVRMIGGGGGGGGTTGGANTSVGGGGASGVYLELSSAPGDGGAVTIGAAGGGGAGGGGTGATGGDTTVVLNAVLLTAKGGAGAAGQGNAASVFAPGAANTAAGSSTADVALQWAGLHGIDINGFAFGGGGADSPFGSGGLSRAGDTAGAAAAGFGAGGAGASAGATNRAGGAGSAGLIIIEEYS